MSRVTYWIALLAVFAIIVVSWNASHLEITTTSLGMFRTESSVPTLIPTLSSTSMRSPISTSTPTPTPSPTPSSTRSSTPSSRRTSILSATPTSTPSPPSSKPGSWLVNKSVDRTKTFMNPSHNGHKNSSVSHNMTLQNAFHGEVNFNPKTCLVVKMGLFGRTGNNIIQIANLLRVLDLCTGVAYFEEHTHIIGIHFPSLITHTGTYLSAEGRTQIARTCYHINLKEELLNIRKVFKALNNSSCPITKEEFDKNIYSKNTEAMIQSMIGFDGPAYALDLTNTVVAHIRGGDVFSAKPHPGYQQPPCSFYINSIRHANASKAIVVTEDLTNPCVVEILRNVPDVGLLRGGSVTRALTILFRAPILVQAHSTFNKVAVGASFVPKIVYREDGGETWLTSHVIRDCQVSYSNSSLLPWKASPKQKHLLRVLPSKVERCIEE